MRKNLSFLVIPFLMWTSLEGAIGNPCQENFYAKIGGGYPQFVIGGLGYRTFYTWFGYDLSVDGFWSYNDFGGGAKALQLFRWDTKCYDYFYAGLGIGGNGLSNKNLSYEGPDRYVLDPETNQQVNKGPERINPWIQMTGEGLIGYSWETESNWVNFIQISFGKVLFDGRKLEDFDRGWRIRAEYGFFFY